MANRKSQMAANGQWQKANGGAHFLHSFLSCSFRASGWLPAAAIIFFMCVCVCECAEKCSFDTCQSALSFQCVRVRVFVFACTSFCPERAQNVKAKAKAKKKRNESFFYAAAAARCQIVFAVALASLPLATITANAAAVAVAVACLKAKDSSQRSVRKVKSPRAVWRHDTNINRDADTLVHVYVRSLARLLNVTVVQNAPKKAIKTNNKRKQKTQIKH